MSTVNAPQLTSPAAADDDQLDDDDFVFNRKNRDDEEMDITPMIDITFLLLIFFVVCSTMDPKKMGKIPSAKNGTNVSADDSAVIFVKNEGPDKIEVLREDQSPFNPDEDAQVSEIVQYITDETERAVGRPKKHVMIFGDQDVDVRHVFRVQRIIGDAFPEMEQTYVAVKEE